MLQGTGQGVSSTAVHAARRPIKPPGPITDSRVCNLSSCRRNLPELSNNMRTKIGKTTIPLIIEIPGTPRDWSPPLLDVVGPSWSQTQAGSDRDRGDAGSGSCSSQN